MKKRILGILVLVVCLNIKASVFIHYPVGHITINNSFGQKIMLEHALQCHQNGSESFELFITNENQMRETLQGLSFDPQIWDKSLVDNDAIVDHIIAVCKGFSAQLNHQELARREEEGKANKMINNINNINRSNDSSSEKLETIKNLLNISPSQNDLLTPGPIVNLSNNQKRRSFLNGFATAGVGLAVIQSNQYHLPKTGFGTVKNFFMTYSQPLYQASVAGASGWLLYEANRSVKHALTDEKFATMSPYLKGAAALATGLLAKKACDLVFQETNIPLVVGTGAVLTSAVYQFDVLSKVKQLSCSTAPAA